MSYPLTHVAFPRIGLAASVRSSFAHWGALLWRALVQSGEQRAAQYLPQHLRGSTAPRQR